MRLAWFSPLPPVRSGIATYSAELVPTLVGQETDLFVDAADEAQPGGRIFSAHDFLWKNQLVPYDLVVYQLGNAPCHDYMWAYLASFPGLVVLHDARLHQSRARRLLNKERFDDYRREFAYDHPDATPDFAEYAVEGLGGPIYYLWAMLRVAMNTARLVAVHNPRVAIGLAEAYPDTPIETIRMGVPPLAAEPARGRAVRQRLGIPADAVVFAAFGKVTAEKRIAPILEALGALAADGLNAHLLLVGDTNGYPTLDADMARLGVRERTHATGFVPDEAIGEYLAAADACLCLRWPTAMETSASWLRCLAAARATIITELPHQVDIPALDPRTWRARGAAAEPVTMAIDLLDEAASLLAAMRRLAGDGALRGALARAGHAYWAAGHMLDAMTADYGRLLAAAARAPVRRAQSLPAHFTSDNSGHVRALAREFGIDVDILR